MIEMNEIMKKILRENVEEQDSEIEVIVNKIVEKTKPIKECIIFDQDGTLEESKINFERILKFVGDYTGYEVSCNEFRFGETEISLNQIANLAKTMSVKLSQKYPGKKFIVIISLHDEEIELRFHTNRENEKPWLDSDLNKYQTATLCSR